MEVRKNLLMEFLRLLLLVKLKLKENLVHLNSYSKLRRTFHIKHNHNLSNTQIINDKVIGDIEKVKNKFKTTESLKKHLNSEHKLELSYNQVYYQSMKAYQLFSLF